MLGFAKAHPILLACLVAGASGGLLTVAGPALVVVMADLFLPGTAAASGAAAVLNLLLVLFHASLIAAAALLVSALLRRLGRR